MRASRERGGPTHGRNASDVADAAGAAAVGDRLAARRRDAGLTLAQLAERAELSAAYISQIEAGAANPTLSTLHRVTEALGAQLADLFGRPVGPASGDAFPAVVRRTPVTPDGTGRVWPYGSPDARRLVPRLVAGVAEDHVVDVRHDGEELVTVLAGGYRLWIAGRPTELGPGDACHLHASVAHRLEPLGPDARCLVVLSAP